MVLCSVESTGLHSTFFTHSIVVNRLYISYMAAFQLASYSYARCKRYQHCKSNTGKAETF